jgi:peptide/nickel transport system substrate-binding protein
VGPVSPANRFWFNSKLAPHPYDPRAALERLARAGFRLQDGTLRDAAGQPVEFSIITNAGNRPREQMAVMIQEDLRRIGIRVHVAPLDFPSLIERITASFRYEVCLLALTNVDLDPGSQTNVWLSSAANHQWNPRQPRPETPWEAEIDRLIRAQSSTPDPARRKAYFDEVQAIAHREVPFIYLVNKNALVAVGASVRNAAPVVVRPQVFWNVDTLTKLSQVAGR